MASAAGSQLSLVQDVVEQPLDILPAAIRDAYQRQLFEAFLVSRRVSGGRFTVQASLSAIRANFLPWLAARGLYVWDVQPEDVDEWALALKNSVKTRTHQQYFIQLHKFYSWLVVRRADEILQRTGARVRNPVDQFNRARRMPEDERLVPVPREEIIDYFLAAGKARISSARSDFQWLQACRNYTMWMVLNWSGLRRMELTALVRDDVDLVAGVLRVREGKGGKGRLVHIQPPLAPVLRWYLQEVRSQVRCGWRVPHLFLGSSQRPLDPDSVRHLLHHEQLETRLGCDDWFTCHGFRRAFATRLYKTLRQQRFRDPLIYVKEQLGHKYISTTQRYCQLDDDFRYFLVKEAEQALTEHYAQESRSKVPHDH